MPVYVQNPDPRSLVTRGADDLLAADTRVGAVELLVRDLETMIEFYSTGMTLDVLEQVGDSAALGRDGRVLVRMRRMPDLPPRRPPPSAMCTYRWATSPRPATSTSTRWASR